MNGHSTNLTNGRAAAAILSAALGCFSLGLLQVGAAVSKTLGKMLLFSPASGALSGETTIAILIWLLSWGLLGQFWRHAVVNMRKINLTSASLLIVGALLTFPPLDDFIGKL